MLIALHIKDFVIVDQLALDFSAGFGTLTGETGAGKSILVDALALVLGERADTGVVRAGCDKAEILAQFDLSALPAVKQWLEEHELANSAAPDDLLLRRVIDSGKSGSRVWINGVPTTLTQVKELGESLVDIHGQHAHQSLLRAEAQRELLDTHAGLAELSAATNKAWWLWQEAERTLQTASNDSAALMREKEQLEWQVQELESLAFNAEEWETLESEQKRLAHAASLIEGAQLALTTLSEGDAACSQQIDMITGRLQNLSEFDPALGEVSTLLQSIQAELAEVISSLRRYGDHVELDPARQAEVEQRIEAIEACARKYRILPMQLGEQLGQWQSRLAMLTASADLAALKAKAEALRRDYFTTAEKLSLGRQATARGLSAAVTGIMGQLALANGVLDIALIALPEGGAHGLEQIEFRVSGLAGKELKPLSKVVSGGELSRISLAIQVITSRSARVPTLIFDEVDVGIGGGVAEIVGRLLHELGQERQVLCVTHLPQVASRADWQWQISKTTVAGQTLSRVQPLSADERVDEIARMLGGVEITDITRRHASEMLGYQ